jgi:hypothetical protein
MVDTRTTASIAGFSSDGGYIVTPLSPAADMVDTADGLHPLSGIVIPKPTAPNVAIRDEANQTPVLIDTSGKPRDLLFSGALDNDFGGFNIPESGIRPSVIPIFNLVENVPKSVGPILAAHRDEPTSQDEGGAISVAAILSSVDSSEIVETGDWSLPTFAQRASDETPVAARLSGEPEIRGSNITGEWARATAFETAGGEPTDDERRSVSDGNDARLRFGVTATPSRRELESYHDAQRAAQERAAAHYVAARESRAAPAGENWSEASTLQLRVTEFSQLDRRTYVRLPDPSQHPSNQAATARGNLTGTSLVFEAAHAAAFDQFGDDANSAEPAWAIDLSWRSTLNATPLLMILALERIAASNSRRASRHVAIEVAKPRAEGSKPLLM